jgi:hypothetical protein
MSGYYLECSCGRKTRIPAHRRGESADALASRSVVLCRECMDAHLAAKRLGLKKGATVARLSDLSAAFAAFAVSSSKPRPLARRPIEARPAPPVFVSLEDVDYERLVSGGEGSDGD